MVVYQGGKARLGRRIHDVISTLEKDLYGDTEPRKPYFEPFVGMAGVLGHFGKDGDRLIFACDVNIDIIMMWQEFQKGWKPSLTCSEKKYNELKNSKKHSAERGFIGAAASWGGNFFHAYRLKYKSKNGRDYLKEAWSSINKILPHLDNVEFLDARSYEDFNIDSGIVIYADPPYLNNTLSNKLFQHFDHKKFWDKIRKWSENNLVIISESSAPSDFKKIWSARGSISTGQGRKVSSFEENLYVYKPVYDRLSTKAKKAMKSI